MSVENPTAEEVRYEHDCALCVFLGRHDDADLYVHPVGITTIIARYSSDGQHYISGWAFAEDNPDLFEAKARASALGFKAEGNGNG